MGHSSPTITRAALEKFKAIYQGKHGESLSDDEAAAIAGRLLRVVSVFLRISARNVPEPEGSNRVPVDQIEPQSLG
jgi:hypothetical protein